MSRKNMAAETMGAITLTILILIPLLGQSVHINNEFCRARPSLVAIDNPSFKYFPFFVKLHRCGGSCDTIRPSVQGCVPLQYEEVPITVQIVGTRSTVVVMEKNHTRCGCECVIGPTDCNLELEDWRPDTCQCKCRYRDAPPVPCGQGFRWSRKKCRCVCNKEPEDCPPNKVWNSEACGCRCKDRRYNNCARRQQFVNEETCMCSNIMPVTGHVSAPKPAEQGGLRQELYVVIFVAEFAFMFLIFDALLYCKKAGLMYHVTRKCSRKGQSSDIEDSREDIFNDTANTKFTDAPSLKGEDNLVARSALEGYDVKM